MKETEVDRVSVGGVVRINMGVVTAVLALACAVALVESAGVDLGEIFIIRFDANGASSDTMFEVIA